MLTAKDIMTTEVVTVTEATDISEVARLLLEKRFNGAPVVDADGALVGVICQSDLITQQKRVKMPSLFTVLDGFIPLGSTAALEKEIEKIAATTVGQAMTRDPVFVAPNVPVEVIASLMVDRKLHTLPVVDEGRLVGVIGKEDVLRVLVGGK
ncbi:MAG: CBS domain-containing protein [Desulfovibrionaceae bacterium]|jgi:CBS domain-containing protein|nr:CBS domain-containing protein [Desulfovibrionaceae bacterium]